MKEQKELQTAFKNPSPKPAPAQKPAPAPKPPASQPASQAATPPTHKKQPASQENTKQPPKTTPAPAQNEAAGPPKSTTRPAAQKKPAQKPAQDKKAGEAPKTTGPVPETPAAQPKPATPTPSNAPAKQRSATPESETRRLPGTNRLSLHRADTSNKKPEPHQRQRKVDIHGLNGAQMAFETQRINGDAHRQKATITIIENVSPEDPQTTLLGLCIRDRYGIRFETYPTREPVEDVLPHVLDLGMRNAPAMCELLVCTNFPHLRPTDHVSRSTIEHLKKNDCTVRNRKPNAFDLSATFARLAARGITGPTEVDYHLYTASLNDGQQTYAAAVLWGRNRAKYFVQTLHNTDVIEAEAKMAVWAMRQMHESSDVFIFNASPIMRGVWENPETMPPHIKPQMKQVIRTMVSKHLRSRQKADRPLASINRTVRQQVADLYAGHDIAEDLNYLKPKTARKQP